MFTTQAALTEFSTRCAVVCAFLVLMLFRPGTAEAGQLPERCRETAQNTERRLPLTYRPMASGEPVYLRVQGVRYAIPASYFRHPPIGCDTEEKAFLLRVLLPSFEGWSELNDVQLQGSPGTPNMGMNILLQTVPYSGLARAFGAVAKGADPKGDHPLWDGLLHTKNQYGHDVFFLRENGEVTFIMVCRTTAHGPFPGCAQHYRYRGAQLEAAFFSRSNITIWREIRDGTVALLDRFAHEAQ